MRIVFMSLMAVACEASWDLSERQPDYQPPPGVGGLELVGPTAVRSGDPTVWYARSPELPVGTSVSLGWGGINGPGPCPYRQRVGGHLCLDVASPAHHFATRVAVADPERPGEGMVAFDVPAPPTNRAQIFLQAISVDGLDSATSNVLPVDVCPPSCGPVVVQSGVDGTRDIWTTSDFSYAGGGGGPGGGLDDDELRVGGWGDDYYSLVRFDLTSAPVRASQVVLELHVARVQGNGAPDVFVDQVTDAWDWKTSGTGSDNERLWWADRPTHAPWVATAMTTPPPGGWFSVDITGLYNDWQANLLPNEGIQIRPNSTANEFVMFHSSGAADPSLHPRLVVTP